jgi:hypothetical protein
MEIGKEIPQGLKPDVDVGRFVRGLKPLAPSGVHGDRKRDSSGAKARC